MTIEVFDIHRSPFKEARNFANYAVVIHYFGRITFQKKSVVDKLHTQEMEI